MYTDPVKCDLVTEVLKCLKKTPKTLHVSRSLTHIKRKAHSHVGLHNTHVRSGRASARTPPHPSPIRATDGGNPLYLTGLPVSFPRERRGREGQPSSEGFLRYTSQAAQHAHIHIDTQTNGQTRQPVAAPARVHARLDAHASTAPRGAPHGRAGGEHAPPRDDHPRRLSLHKRRTVQSRQHADTQAQSQRLRTLPRCGLATPKQYEQALPTTALDTSMHALRSHELAACASTLSLTCAHCAQTRRDGCVVEGGENVDGEMTRVDDDVLNVVDLS
jgi:hypothetical protein